MSGDRPASEAAPIGSRRLGLTVTAVVFVVAGGLAEFSVRLLRPEWRDRAPQDSERAAVGSLS